uniref:Ig-like domain-containing protein n=1 Tax=Oryzias latipes TaxID=8090 RepID=A0A3B3I8U8_ORYLA
SSVRHDDCVRAAVKVLQSEDLLSQAGAPLTLQCSMGGGLSMGSHTMLWYRQNRHGAQLEFLIKEYQDTAGRFHSSIDTNQNNFTLHLSGLLVNDSSTYFCAASHSAAPGPCSLTNTCSACRKQLQFILKSEGRDGSYQTS